MSKPTPSAEIIITKAIGATDQCFDITCTSDDARAWLEKNAPPYGQLIPPIQSKHNAYRLIVSPAYDAEEVKRYILSQGK